MTTKIVVISAIIAVFAGRTYAQQNTSPNPQVLKMDYIQKVEKYRKMRGAGAALTVIGSVLVIAGVVTVYNSMWDYDSYEKTSTGSAIALGGYACLGAGIPLWIVGGVQHKKYSAKVQELSIKMNTTPQSQGLTLTYRF